MQLEIADPVLDPGAQAAPCSAPAVTMCCFQGSCPAALDASHIPGQPSPAHPSVAVPYFRDETPYKVQALGFCWFVTPGTEGQQLLTLEPSCYQFHQHRWSLFPAQAILGL